MIFRFSIFVKNLIQKIFVLDFEYICKNQKKSNLDYFIPFRRVCLVIKFKFSRILQNRSEPELNEKRLRFYFLREVQRFHPEVWIENWWAKCYKIDEMLMIFCSKPTKSYQFRSFFAKFQFHQKFDTRSRFPKVSCPTVMPLVERATPVALNLEHQPYLG